MAKTKAIQAKGEVITLGTPLGTDDNPIKEINVTRPSSGALRGMSLVDLARMETSALREIFPRVTGGLTTSDFDQLEPYDMMQFGKTIATFLGTPPAK